jgi:hypothetical protein
MARKRSGISDLTSVMLQGQTKSLLEIELDNHGAFGYTANVQPYGAIELSAAYPISELRDSQYTSGSGSITRVNSEYRLSITNPGDEALLESSRRGRYIPGYEAAAGVGVRLDIPNDTISGDLVAEWGYFDTISGTPGSVNDGLLFGVDSSGTYVRVMNSGSEIHKTYSDAWNVDNAPNGATVTPFNALGHGGAIYEVRFVYYGYGLVQWIINDGHTGDLSMRNFTMHTFKPDGAPLLSNPNLKVGAYLMTTSGSETGDLYVGGRKFHVLGDYRPQARITSNAVTGLSTSTTLTPVMSFRRKAGNRETTINPEGIATLAQSEDAIVSIRVGSTLTGANFGSIPGVQASETALELDTSASAIDSSTGVKIFEGLVASGQANRSTAFTTKELITDIPDETVVTFCVRTTTGTGSCDMVGRIREEF